MTGTRSAGRYRGVLVKPPWRSNLLRQRRHPDRDRRAGAAEMTNPQPQSPHRRSSWQVPIFHRCSHAAMTGWARCFARSRRRSTIFPGAARWRDLPASAKVEAKFEKGVLRVRLPKPAEITKKEKKIAIRAG